MATYDEAREGWTEDWPPTARFGFLIKCDQPPGYYTDGDLPALFCPGDAAIRTDNLGVTGFPPEREIVPADGLHVIEKSLSRDKDHLNNRYAVVRRG